MKRGQIYMVNFDPVIGSEQGGMRPALIIQNDVGNQHSPTVIVAPITSKLKHTVPTHVEIGQTVALPKPSQILLEQIRTVDKTRVGDYLAELEPVKLKQVRRALKISLDL